MTELKNKLIEAIKKIDFKKLNIYELKTVADISETVDKLDKKDYTEILAERMKNITDNTNFELNEPKTIGELKED